MSFPIQLDRPIVVFDIESTGLSPRKDRIIELSAVRINIDGTEETKTWLLNPCVPIPKETSDIHGITDDIVKDCPTFLDRSKEIAEFFADADLSGFNSDRFDIPCLEEEFARAGINLAVANRRRIDVQRIYHKMHPRDLSAAVREYLGREHEGAHGAEADTLATVAILKEQLKRHSDLPRTVAEIDSWIAPTDHLNADRDGLFRWKDGEWTVNFGKKKGESLKRIMLDEPNFLKWMIKGDFPVDARMIATDALKGRLPPPPQLPTPPSA
jgi:DNA polymerase-3 subunit epsilon